MDAAVVVIEVAAPEPPGEHLSALVAACNRASERAACVLAEHAPEAVPFGVAIVKSDGNHVRVEFGLRRSGQNEWHRREFDFSEHDDEFERWRTVGFAIGTLAQATEKAAQEAEAAKAEAQLEQRPAPAAAPAPDLPPAPRRAAPSAPAGARVAAAWFDGAFGAGPAHDGGRWRALGLVRTGLELFPSGPFFTASTFFSRSLPGAPSKLELQWLGFAAGGGYPVLASPAGFRLEARLEAVFTQLAVSTSDELGRSDRGDRWLFGGRGGVDGAAPLATWLAVFAYGEVMAGAPTDILIGGERVASVPALGYALGLGLRVRLR